MSAEQRDLDMDDAGLEAAIEFAALKVMTGTTIQRRRDAYEELRRLVKQRSPRQVRRMEEARGLTR